MRSCILLIIIPFVLATESLEEYNVDVKQVSTSGISSGAAMAVQFHVAYSEFVCGVGTVAGVPYYCARGSFFYTSSCMLTPSQVPMSTLINKAREYAEDGDISDVSHLRDSKVFIVQGTKDSIVKPASADNLVEFYSAFGADIGKKTNLRAQHTQPTNDYGGSCSSLTSSFIGRCHYDAAFHILDHIYDDLTAPVGHVQLSGKFYTFDQKDYFYSSSPTWWGMDTKGFVYVPSACIHGEACKLHVVFHGCGQNRQILGDKFATKTGYNEVGEMNNIIMLYPQAYKSWTNLQGCWDWWGLNYYSKYATQTGHQILAVCRMVERITGALVCAEPDP